LKKVVVLGAGYAGVFAAKKIAKMSRKKKLGDVEISIIDRNPFHTMLTELHEVAAGRVEEDSIRISLARVFAGRKVNVIHDKIIGTDFDARKITGEHGIYDYDYLVMADGSRPTYFGVQGAKENSFTLWSYDDAVRLREHILEMFRAASIEPDIEKKKELLSFFVVGAGFTGVEMAGELAEFAPSLCARFEVDPSLVKIVDADILERPCPVLPEKASSKIRGRLEKMKVNVMVKTNIKGVGKDYAEYDAGQGINRVPTRTVIWTAGVEGEQIVQDSKALGAAGRGRIQTDEYLRSQNYKNVYVAGDNVFYIPEGEKAPVPQMVENAEQSAHTVARNLLTDLTGKGEKEKYVPKFHGVMVCVGGRWGSAQVGTVNHKIILPSFIAMFVKHFTNIIYFIQVLGWNKVFSYLRHEFFTVRNKRSFVGGHFSNRGPNFLAVPLRVFLGFYWVYEGIMKITEGWMKSPQLANMINGTNSWYDSMLSSVSTGPSAAADAVASATSTAVTTATTAAADVLASATGAATNAAAASTVTASSNVLINWNILGLIHPILIGGSSADQVAFKLKVPLIDWIMNPMLSSGGMQVFMQITIVLLEILVGLALMGGLFTTLAGVGSVVLQTMFMTTTGLYMTGWWMIPASIAVMFSAGTVFSFDYYVMPWLKKHWKHVKFVRKWYIYND